MKKRSDFLHTISIHFKGARELHRLTPMLFSTLIISNVISGILPYVTVFFSARILTELSGECRSDILWQWVLASVLTLGALGILRAIFNQLYTVYFADTWGRKEILYCRKSFSMDYADIEDQAIIDKRSQIFQNNDWAGWGFGRIIDISDSLIRSIVGIISGITLTVSLFTSVVPPEGGVLTLMNSPLLVIVFAAVIISICLLTGKLAGMVVMAYSKISDKARFGNRIFSFFGFIGTETSRAVDIRMYEQESIVNHYWKSFKVFEHDGYCGKMALGKDGILGGISNAISTITVGFVYIFTCLKAIGGAFGIGSITQYVCAVTEMADSLCTLLQTIGYMKANTEHLDRIFEYLDLPNKMYQGSLTTEKRADRQYEVEFRDVSFKYPATENWALRHVNIRFKVGKRLAIVGENGSGKTTFIKLLCRLYDPQEGQILLNGIDIRKYRYDDYMNIFSIVFQDFKLISQPLGANVAGSEHYDRERVKKALIDAGFGDRLEQMPHGLDTMLYKDLSDEGVNLSGGEAQKVAIARALYKDAPFIVLDEPTAALDPIAEAEIYSKFNDIVHDKTAIFISHRLSSCKFCDEIAVFDNGSVIQHASHDELIADASGKYRELWDAQAQYYTEQKSAEQT